MYPSTYYCGNADKCDSLWKHLSEHEINCPTKTSMSFLLGDLYDSGSSSEAEDDGDESDSNACSVEEGNPKAEDFTKLTEGTVLLSADDVFADVSTRSASFRAPKHNLVTQDQVVHTFDHLKQDEQVDKVADETNEISEPSSVRTVGVKREAPEASESNAKREKKGVKERVKTQRERGQAGIGSDFKTWKSDAEMVLRQQYD